MIKTQEGNLYTDLFTKPTDTHSYLWYSSCHPLHIKKSIPYSQFLRVRRICSKDSDFAKHSEHSKECFKNRGYPTNIVDEALSKVSKFNQADLILKRSVDENTDLDKESPNYLITTYSPDYEKINTRANR